MVDGRVAGGVSPDDRKMGKVVTGLQSNLVTTHEIINNDILDELKNRERLSKEIDAVLNNKMPRYSSVMITDHTPGLLLNVGLNNYPILMSQSHIRNCLHKKGESARWHGLSKGYLLRLEEYLKDPAIVYDSLTGDDSIVVVTGEVDSDKLPVIVSIKMNGKGQYESNVISSNYLTSTYGHEHFANVLQRAIRGNDVLYVNKEKTQNLESFAKLQLLGKFSKDFEFDKIIHKSNNIVNEDMYTLDEIYFELAEHVEKVMKGEKEMADQEKNGTKLYITLNKAFCRQTDDKFVEGKLFNIMTMPKGTTLNGKDIGGCTISPLYMSESKGNPNNMVATYYLKENEATEIKLTAKDGSYSKVDVVSLKEAIDSQQKLYREQQQERQKEKEQTKTKAVSKTKEKGEELE